MEKTELIQNIDETESLDNRTEILAPTQGEQTNFTGGFLQIGDNIKGWEITGKLNVRSLEAEVYRAKKDGQEGIVKYYRGITNPKTDILERIKGLDHDDIVNLYEVGIHNGKLFEIMEFCAGGALDSRNEDGSYKYLPLSEEEVIDLCRETVNAFKDCHSRGIIHRDIKPGNIYYRQCSETPDENGKYKGIDFVIADFGISSVSDDSEKYHKTRTATRTSSYAAPEILFGEINYKYDYYSLGVTIWEAAMGKEPYTENGRKLDSTYIMQLATEGFAADNLLRTKPFLSEKLQRLIRGLLVVNPDHRWGYEEVMAHLEGKEVSVWVPQEKFPDIKIGDKVCSDFDELAEAIIDNMEAAHEMIKKGHLKAKFNNETYSKKANQIGQIAEMMSAKEISVSNGIYKIAWTLSLNAPFKTDYGFSARGFDDIMSLIANAPEAMLPFIRNIKSRFYAYLEVLDKAEQAQEIKKIAVMGLGDAELICKTQVILNDRYITPYKLAKYQGFVLDTPENLVVQEIPEDLKKRILLLIKERSYEGLIYPWIDLHLKERGIDLLAELDKKENEENEDNALEKWKKLTDLFKKAA